MSHYLLHRDPRFWSEPLITLRLKHGQPVTAAKR
ncbi:MAG: cytochrome P450 [Anaerolineae bacterium]|nr:cytochrome P450 [Anaerolineae bacterium]